MGDTGGFYPPILKQEIVPEKSAKYKKLGLSIGHGDREPDYADYL